MLLPEYYSQMTIEGNFNIVADWHPVLFIPGVELRYFLIRGYIVSTKLII